MAETVVMPQAGNSVESCIVLSWRVAEGDTVAMGEVICEIETDKATMEVESTAEGTVLRRFAVEGDEVAVKAPLLLVGAAGETATDFSDAANGSTSQSVPGPTAASPSAASAAATPPVAPATPTSTAPAAGTIVRSFSTGVVRVSPRARNRARELAVDPATLTGSGPGGRVIERDVLAAAAAPQAAAAPAAAPAAAVDVAVTGIRKTIARRMQTSLQESAQLTLYRRADARALLDYRSKVKEAGAAFFEGTITINDMILFAVSRVLPKWPEMNAHFLETVIRRYPTVDLGVAVDTPRGLLVPTITSADSRSLSGIAGEMRRLAERAVDGTATPEDLGPATFTVTNLGGLGIELFTPVLNTPQVGILGVGTIVPGYDDDGELVPQIGLSLTIDHRAIDGAPAARFLQDLAGSIAQFPLTLAR